VSFFIKKPAATWGGPSIVWGGGRAPKSDSTSANLANFALKKNRRWAGVLGQGKGSKRRGEGGGIPKTRGKRHKKQTSKKEGNNVERGKKMKHTQELRSQGAGLGRTGYLQK